MKRLLQAYRFLWISALVLLSLAIALETYFLNKETDIKRFKKILRVKEKQTEKAFFQFQDTKNFIDFSTKSPSNIQKDALIFLVYEDKELVYWSNNLIDVPEVYENTFYDQSLLKLNNGFYAVYKHSHLNRKIIGLIPIFYEYSTTNSFLKNRFHQDFSLLYQTHLSLDAQQGHFISNKDGKFLFSLVQTNTLNKDTNVCIFITILYFFGILLLFGYSLIRLRRLPVRSQLGLIGILSILLIAARLFMLSFQIPPSLYSLQLFTPNLHASSEIFRSLGDYWLNSLSLFLWLYMVSSFKLSHSIIVKTSRRTYLIFCLLIIFSILYTLFVFGQIKSLVLNSSFSLQVHKGSGIEVYAIWGYAGAALFLAGIILLIKKITDSFSLLIRLNHFYKIWFLILGIAILITPYFNRFAVLHLLFLTVLMIMQGAVHFRANKNISYTIQIIVLFFSALYLTTIISVYAQEKEQQIRLAKAESIVESNDPKTKVRLETMSSDWNKDKMLLKLFQDPVSNEKLIKEHLHNQYFNKAWANYNVQIIICLESDQLEIISGNNAKTYNNCFNIFRDVLQTSVRIGNSSFYELTTQKGLSSYLGMLSFRNELYGEVRLFIRIDLKPYENEQGYPELLISSDREIGSYNRYSFAKYINNKLRYSSGNFDYYSTLKNFKRDKKLKTKNYFIKTDGYNHYIYNVSDSYKIIVSEEELSLYKKYIAFPYIFFLLFFAFAAVWSLDAFPWYFSLIYTFRQQLKITLITMTGLVFIVVGGASLYYNFASNRSRYTKEHKDKIQMLRKELFANIESARDLAPEFNPILQQNLKNYAHILDADINIYDTYGVLLATSQPDIFAKGLLSNRMNYNVLEELNNHEATKVTAQERIGNLEYSSVYVTLWNNKNEVVAYLNVPYFMKYKKFKAEMQDVIVGVLNVNLLIIILAFLIAFAISQRITHPLVILRDKFLQIRIGKKNEKINYLKNDEIKVVVDAYNKMVDELEESTKRLTQSERESAWKEMARQVAHEIKNPLTPMKLNIQFLQRNLMQKSEDWQDKFKELSNMILKQIDELSTIASAFSDFAKMPKLQKEKINLLSTLEDLVQLYNKGEIDVLLVSELKEAWIFADNNRLRRAFINLITNALQSIRNSEKGKVEIIVQQKQSEFIEIAIFDNGKGIPDGIKAKIFSPNFTTKSSGMGLGLALTKDIINQANGIISFESEVDKGTVFRVTLPTLEYHL